MAVELNDGEIKLIQQVNLLSQEVSFPFQYTSFVPDFLSHFRSTDPVNLYPLLQAKRQELP